MIMQSAFLFVLFLLWYGVTASGIVNPMFLPTPVETISAGTHLVANKTIFLDCLCSFSRIITGVSISVVIGIPLGMCLGYNASVYRLCMPFIDFLRSIPPILTFPVALLVFGTGEESRVVVIVFGCLLIMILNTSLGVNNHRTLRVAAATIMGARWHQLMVKIMFFEALPQIFVGIRISLSMGVIIGIVTEMIIGTRHGLGSRMVYAQTSYAIPEMYFLIVVVGLIGMSMNKLLIITERSIVHWNRGPY